MRITGVVKGTEQDAVVAANKHGLHIKVLHVLADRVTVEFTGHRRGDKAEITPLIETAEYYITKWFAESPITASFPAGTLLLYSHHSDRLLPSEQEGYNASTPTCRGR